MKRKIAFMLFAALISASLLAGCQNKPVETPDNSENTENTDTPSTSDVSGSEVPGSGETGEAADNTDTEQKENTDISGYAEAYLETVNAFNDEYKNAENTTYDLIDLDGKGAPEIVIYMTGYVNKYP